MKKNMGTADRIIRTLLALLVIVLYSTGDISGLVAVILGLISIIFLVTSFTGFCPMYKMINVSTQKK